MANPFGEGNHVEHPNDPDRLLTVSEVAERLALTPWSVYQMTAAGVLAVHRTGAKGRTIRIAERDLADYLQNRRSTTARATKPAAAATR